MDKNVVKVNNKGMVEFLESWVGPQTAKAFDKNDAYVGFLERELIETIAVTPIRLKVWEKDGTTKEQILKDRIGFDLLIETNENKISPYRCTYLFNDDWKIEKALNVHSAIDMVSHKDRMEALKIFGNIFLDRVKMDALTGSSVNRNSRDLESWLELGEFSESLVFNNNGKNITMKTTKMKDKLSEKISCSEQLENIINPIKKEVNNKREKEMER